MCCRHGNWSCRIEPRSRRSEPRSRGNRSAAYWSIATTMKSDTGALSAVTDALSLGSSTVGTATTALNRTLSILTKIKADLVKAQTPGTDAAQVQSEITAQQQSLKSIIFSASFNGVNLLDGTANAGSGDVFRLRSPGSRPETRASAPSRWTPAPPARSTAAQQDLSGPLLAPHQPLALEGPVRQLLAGTMQPTAYSVFVISYSTTGPGEPAGPSLLGRIGGLQTLEEAHHQGREHPHAYAPRKSAESYLRASGPQAIRSRVRTGTLT